MDGRTATSSVPMRRDTPSAGWFRPLLVAIAIVAAVWVPRATRAQGVVVSEGLERLGAYAWHEKSYDGRGTVAVVWDTGFLGFEELLGAELPPADRVTALGLDIPVTGAPEDGSRARHGTAVAEILHDIAPAARLCLLATPPTIDPARVEEVLLGWAPDVVVISVYGGISCASGGESSYERLLRALWNAGVLVVVASGNDGESTWHGTFHDPDGDGDHDFRSYDDALNLTVFPGDIIELRLHWEDVCSASDNGYEILLFHHTGTLIATSDGEGTPGTPIESLHVEGLPSGTYLARIRKDPGADPVELHLRWINGRRMEYALSSGSIAYLLPACSPYVLTVGAVNWYTQWLEPYSGRGPTHDGTIKPELTAPDHVHTVTTGPAVERGGAWIGGFSGTSAAAPHVAGAALLLKQAYPESGPRELRDLLMASAEDRGPEGIDPQFGAGIVRLPPPPET
ncbi:MAG: S8 family serine peptidase [Candidatus Bipolaricaulota bacterium]|nr:MAG: S8 family serine peptidase [Candidatus Bipolaricaulota bacterium]